MRCEESKKRNDTLHGNPVIHPSQHACTCVASKKTSTMPVSFSTLTLPLPVQNRLPVQTQKLIDISSRINPNPLG